MCPGAGLHNDGTRVKRGKEFEQLLASRILAKHRFADAVLAMNMKRMFAQINPIIVTLCMTMASRGNYQAACPSGAGWDDHAITVVETAAFGCIAVAPAPDRRTKTNRRFSE